MHRFFTLLTAVVLIISTSPCPAAEEAKPKGAVIEFSAEASRPAANDMARVSVYAEASGASPGEIAQKVNSAIDAALKTVKTFPGVKTQTGGMSTYPSYDKNGRITGWRMRSALELEARDMAKLSGLMGRLQETLAVGRISLLPSPETLKQCEDEATLEADRKSVV